MADRVLAIVESRGRKKSILTDDILWIPSGKISTSNTIIDLDLLSGLLDNAMTIHKTDIIDFHENDYVHSHGDEHIFGNKTFEGTVTFIHSIEVPTGSINLDKLNIQNIPGEDGQVITPKNGEYSFEWPSITMFKDAGYVTGEVIHPGDVLAINDDKKIVKLDASSSGANKYRFIGIYNGDAIVDVGNPIKFVTYGVCKLPDNTFTGPNHTVYVDQLNPGKMTEITPNIPGRLLVQIGYTLDHNLLLVLPMPVISL